MLDEIAGDEMRLSALFIGTQGEAPPPVDLGGREVPASILLICGARALWRARFGVPTHDASSYSWHGGCYDLAGLGDDLRIAFVS